MSWRRHIGAAIGVGAVVLTAVGVFAPDRLVGYVPPAAEEVLTQQPVRPAIAALLAVYAVGMVSLRGWLSPIREELIAPADTESGGTDEGSDPEAGGETHPNGADRGSTTSAPESISVFGRDVLRFGTRTDGREHGDADAATTTREAGTASSPAEDTDRPTESRVISTPPAEFEELQSTPPERPQLDAGSVVGSDFDGSLEKAIRSYGRRDDPLSVFDADTDLTERSMSSARPEDAVRNRIVTLAETVERSGRGSVEPPGSPDEPTTDAAVQSFLNPETADSLGVLGRVRAWLVPESTFERVVERCVESLEDGYDGGRNG